MILLQYHAALRVYLWVYQSKCQSSRFQARSIHYMSMCAAAAVQGHCLGQCFPTTGGTWEDSWDSRHTSKMPMRGYFNGIPGGAKCTWWYRNRKRLGTTGLSNQTLVCYNTLLVYARSNKVSSRCYESMLPQKWTHPHECPAVRSSVSSFFHKKSLVMTVILFLWLCSSITFGNTVIW
jgi:hypothetical protein